MQEEKKTVIEEVEEWRKIDAPFDRYSVSSFGRVRNDKDDYIVPEGSWNESGISPRWNI